VVIHLFSEEGAKKQDKYKSLQHFIKDAQARQRLRAALKSRETVDC
jgi:hypothetical protein